MGYAACKMGVLPHHWREMTYDEAMYVIEYCADQHAREKAEADEAKAKGK